MAEPTAAQRAAVAELKEKFGTQVVRERYVLKGNGHLWVDLTCMAGVWRFTYDQDGTLRHSSLDQLLLIESDNDHTPRSGALPRNAQDDNNT